MCSMFTTFLALMTLFVCCCLTAPIGNSDQSNRRYRSALENPKLFQGDIILPKNNRFAVKGRMYRWPKNTIPYVITIGRMKVKRQIEKAMRHIESKTCIRFVERTFEKNYVKIIDGDGCYSMVGRQGGEQELSLGDGCEPFGTVVHELMHTIGFDHQHNRVDRDDYLNIHWKNIDPEEYDQFQKMTFRNSIIYTPFDYKSIMLYDELAFSKDDVSKTMTAKNPKIRLRSVWDKKFLSKDDMISINKLYNCV